MHLYMYRHLYIYRYMYIVNLHVFAFWVLRFSPPASTTTKQKRIKKKGEERQGSMWVVALKPMVHFFFKEDWWQKVTMRTILQPNQTLKSIEMIQHLFFFFWLKCCRFESPFEWFNWSYEVATYPKQHATKAKLSWGLILPVESRWTSRRYLISSNLSHGTGALHNYSFERRESRTTDWPTAGPWMCDIDPPCMFDISQCAGSDLDEKP